jgi:hypothetical protein
VSRGLRAKPICDACGCAAASRAAERRVRAYLKREDRENEEVLTIGALSAICG